VEHGVPPHKYALTGVGTRMTPEDISRLKAVGLTCPGAGFNSTQISDAIIREELAATTADYSSVSGGHQLPNQTLT